MSAGPASKPVLLAVDDDVAVLSAVARDLRRRYGEGYHVVAADSGERALELVREAKLKGEDVALLLVDQRMPGMAGLEALARARELYPDARRVLLTAYADTDASIRAINETRLHYYLLKPWHPPEERLYPVADDLLDDWRATHRPSISGLTVVGHAFSPASHAVKDFLTRNLVPFRWLDVELSPYAAPLLEAAGAGPSDLPVVVLEDGEALRAPGLSDVAARVGLKQSPATVLNPVRATGLRSEGPYRFVSLSDGTEVGARAVLVATGVAYRRLDTPGADELAGAGVYYGAAATEAMAVSGRRAFVVGGGNSAGQAAMYLSRFAEEVVMVVRGSGLSATMSSYLIAQLEANERVRLRNRTVVARVRGQGRLEGVTLRDLGSGSETDEAAAALFVFIGASPHTGWLPDEVRRDAQGYVYSGDDASQGSEGGQALDRGRMETSLSGVFVAGDVRHRSVKRIASAVGEGAMAVQDVHRYLAGA